ncbi:glutathione S-transferase tau 7 [Euphorbia peplus]|nr:glutathione S-transferase tau 7 [Euphorbia peplus]
MELEHVKLVGAWPSPFSFRVKMALKMKRIEFEYVEEDVLNKSDLLLKSNPIHKKIPVLIHNDKPVCESLVILEYIDEIWNNNNTCLILPQDPYQRATARFWAKFIDEKVLQTAVKISDAKGKHYEELYEELKLDENELKGQDFFGGESVGYLDVVAFSIIYWIRLANEIKQSELISEHKLPVLYKWMEKMKEIELVKELLPPRDQFLSLMAARMQMEPPKAGSR